MNLLDRNLVRINVDLQTKEAVINEMVSLLDDEGRVIDLNKLIEDVHHRELEAPTSMGWGIAIPHAQSESVTHSSLVLMKLKQAIPWNDDQVKILFGIFIPKDKADTKHLAILSALARKLMNENFRVQVDMCSDVDEGYKLLKEIEAEIK